MTAGERYRAQRCGRRQLPRPWRPAGSSWRACWKDGALLSIADRSTIPDIRQVA